MDHFCVCFLLSAEIGIGRMNVHSLGLLAHLLRRWSGDMVGALGIIQEVLGMAAGAASVGVTPPASLHRDGGRLQTRLAGLGAARRTTQCMSRTCQEPLVASLLLVCDLFGVSKSKCPFTGPSDLILGSQKCLSVQHVQRWDIIGPRL